MRHSEIIIRPAISTLWPINRDGEELVAYDFFCSYHEDSPQKHCAICGAVNEIRKQHRLAIEQNKKYLDSIKLNQKDALNQEKRVEPDGTTP